MFKWLINLLKKEVKPEMPFVRGIIVYSDSALQDGNLDEFNKFILVLHGNEIYKKYPYSKSMIKILREIERIPIYDSTKEKKFKEGEEIIPTEVRYESF